MMIILVDFIILVATIGILAMGFTYFDMGKESKNRVVNRIASFFREHPDLSAILLIVDAVLIIPVLIIGTIKSF